MANINKGKKHKTVIAIVETDIELDNVNTRTITGLTELQQFILRCMYMNIKCTIIPQGVISKKWFDK